VGGAARPGGRGAQRPHSPGKHPGLQRHSPITTSRAAGAYRFSHPVRRAHAHSVRHVKPRRLRNPVGEQFPGIAVAYQSGWPYSARAHQITQPGRQLSWPLTGQPQPRRLPREAAPDSRPPREAYPVGQPP